MVVSHFRFARVPARRGVISNLASGAAGLARRASEGRPARDLKFQISNLKWHPVAVPALAVKQRPLALHPSLARRANGGWGNSRWGISLLEVLISMFIMMVGLLGVAALIPVGKFEVQRGAQADRASACGRAAMREIKVRGILDPNNWSLANGNNVDLTTFRAFVIDPLAWTDVANVGLQSFPFDASGSPPATPSPPSIPRATLWPSSVLDPVPPNPGPNGNFTLAEEANMRIALADALFRWQDDLSFEEPSGATALPRQVMQGGAKRLSQGDFSWLATVVPDADFVVPPNPSAVPPIPGNLFDVPMQVSVAVFYKRRLNAPGVGERTCQISYSGSTDGEVTLLLPNSAAIGSEFNGNPAAHLDVKPGQWLMLTGMRTIGGVNRWRYSWHRVVSADAVIDDEAPPNPPNEISVNGPVTGNSWSRRITVAGPDWSNQYGNGVAFLFDGIVAVYEQKMKLERDSIYGN